MAHLARAAEELKSAPARLAKVLEELKSAPSQEELLKGRQERSEEERKSGRQERSALRSGQAPPSKELKSALERLVVLHRGSQLELHKGRQEERPARPRHARTALQR